MQARHSFLCAGAALAALLISAGGFGAGARDAPAAFTAPACSQPTSWLSRHGTRSNPTTADMTEAPEGVPAGTIDPNGHRIGWAIHPRVWRGNTPQPGWTSIVSTGMAYPAEGADPGSSARIQIRDMEVFIKPKAAGRWCLLDRAAAPQGRFFEENFAGDQSIDGSIRPESSGGISIRPIAGRLFHFWGNRTVLPTGGLDGVYVQYQARLIPDDGATTADLAKASYVAAASADYWKSATAPSGHVMSQNEDAAIARFKKVTPQWRLFTMNTDGGPATAPPPAPAAPSS